jgi:hypothetical protein
MSKMSLSAPVRVDRSCPPNGEPVQKNKQLAGLATTPSKANIAGAPRLSCVKKFENIGWKINYRIYLITEVIPKIQP